MDCESGVKKPSVDYGSLWYFKVNRASAEEITWVQSVEIGDLCLGKQASFCDVFCDLLSLQSTDDIIARGSGSLPAVIGNRLISFFVIIRVACQ